MFKTLERVPMLTFGLGIAALLVGAGMMMGARNSGDRGTPANSIDFKPSLASLHAASANSGKTLAMATGQIDDSTEGLFVLDFRTGNLYCWVLNPLDMSKGFLAQFKHNVLADLGLRKGAAPDYVLVTGEIDAIRGAGPRPSRCIAYVGDANTGNVAAYTLAWDLNRARGVLSQVGPMVRVGLGKARPMIDPDDN